MIIDEHFVPAGGLDLNAYIERGDIGGVHHLIRYLWALEVIADLHRVRRILDVACGAGYGSFLFAQKFPQRQVLGVDYDPAAVEEAQRNYSLPNLEYKCGDVNQWDETIGETIFDCIVSFDTIEHVPHRELMMENLVEHLHKRGVLLLSTPCGASTNNLHPDWEYHRIEYSAASLYDFLKRYFKTVRRPDNFTLPHVAVFDRVLSSGIDYLLWMNPVMCEKPINIHNPYRKGNMRGVERYRLLVRARSVWREQGMRTLAEKTLRYIQRRRSRPRSE